ncbi:MAG TPA: hypothetical protein VLA24_09285 [Pseudomonadales bacterium]|nr:hypothetical protein [Pseudomonadales bacterium]
MEEQKIVYEQIAADPEADTAGVASTLMGRVSAGLVRFVIGIAVFAFVCSVPFWWGSWWANDTITTAVNSGSYAQPVYIAEPQSIGYESSTEATGAGCPVDRVIELWRGGSVVGYGCNRD